MRDTGRVFFTAARYGDACVGESLHGDLARSSWSGDASEQAKHSSQRRVSPKAVEEWAYGCVRVCRSEKFVDGG